MKKLSFVCFVITLGFILNQCSFEKRKNRGKVLIGDIKNDFLRSFITEDHMSDEMLMVLSDKDNEKINVKNGIHTVDSGSHGGEPNKNYRFSYRVSPIGQIRLMVVFEFSLFSYDLKTKMDLKEESFDAYFYQDDTRPTFAPDYFILRVSSDNVITIGENTQHHDLKIINDRPFEDIYCKTGVYKSEINNIDSLNYQICVKEGVGLVAVITDEDTLVFDGFEKGPPLQKNY